MRQLTDFTSESLKNGVEERIMRILIISEVFWPEDFLINELAALWKKSGHEVEVISQYPSYPESYVYDGYENKGYSIENWDGIKIHRFHFIEGYKKSKIKKYLNYLLFVRIGNKIAKKIGNSFDIIFVSQTGPLSVALPAIKIKKRFGKKTAIYTCDIWPDVLYSYGIPQKWPFTTILNKFVKYVYGKFDKILVSSERFREVLVKYTDKKISYAPNWIRDNEEKLSSSLSLNNSEFNFTFTGNVSHAQNLMNVVKGFVAAKIQNARLNIVGDGSAIEELRDFLKKNPNANVDLCGRYPHNQMQNILAQSDVCIISLITGTALELTEPLKLQDYLISGKPIYGVLNGSIKDIIEQNFLGLCANPEDINDIAEGFKNMVEFAKSRSNSIIERSIKLIKNRFDKTKIVKYINNEIGI